MEEEKKKPKEYYQINLDTGRIFWIVFIIGLVIIGIFILGFYIGGGRVKEGLFSLEKTRPPGERTVKEVQKEEDAGVPLSELFEDNLTTETRYIEVEGLEGELKTKESQTLRQKPAEESVPQKAKETYGKRDIEKKTTKYSLPGKLKAPAVSGNYYIQVASFEKKDNARRLAESLRKKLYKVVIEKAEVGGKTFYRVRVGPFETKGIATNTMITMKRRFDLKDPFVLKRKS